MLRHAPTVYEISTWQAPYDIEYNVGKNAWVATFWFALIPQDSKIFTSIRAVFSSTDGPCRPSLTQIGHKRIEKFDKADFASSQACALTSAFDIFTRQQLLRLF